MTFTGEMTQHSNCTPAPEKLTSFTGLRQKEKQLGQIHEQTIPPNLGKEQRCPKSSQHLHLPAQRLNESPCVEELGRDRVKRKGSFEGLRESCTFWRDRNSTTRDQQYDRLGMNGWAACWESALRQAEKSESSGENVAEGCNNTLVRRSGKDTTDPGGLETIKGQIPLWPTINTSNLKRRTKYYKEELRNASGLVTEETSSQIVKWYRTATCITNDSWK